MVLKLYQRIQIPNTPYALSQRINQENKPLLLIYYAAHSNREKKKPSVYITHKVGKVIRFSAKYQYQLGQLH